MKKFLIFISTLLSFSLYGQGCDEATKSGLYSVYKKYQDKGLKVIHQKSGLDYMEYLIDESSPQMINQMKIDVSYEIHVNGIDYTYNRFLRRHAYISKNEYTNNRCYLEMLSKMNVAILQRIN